MSTPIRVQKDTALFAALEENFKIQEDAQKKMKEIEDRHKQELREFKMFAKRRCESGAKRVSTLLAEERGVVFDIDTQHMHVDARYKEEFGELYLTIENDGQCDSKPEIVSVMEALAKSLGIDPTKLN